MASNTATDVAGSRTGSNEPDPTPKSNEITSQPGSHAPEPAEDAVEPAELEERKALEEAARAARQQAQRASESGETDKMVRALKEESTANARLRERFGIAVESPKTVRRPLMATPDLWNSQDVRVQPEPAPRSNKTTKPEPTISPSEDGSPSSRSAPKATGRGANLNEREVLEEAVKAAHQRAQRASDSGETSQMAQALRKQEEANKRLSEQFGVRLDLPVEVEVTESAMSTPDIWNSVNTRAQPELAPRSNNTAGSKPEISSSFEGASRPGANVPKPAAGAAQAKYDEQEALVLALKAAHQRVKSATNPTEKAQAMQEMLEAREAITKGFETTTHTTIPALPVEEKMATGQIWNSMNVREQPELAPRSNYPVKDPGPDSSSTSSSSAKKEFPTTPGPKSETVRQRDNVPSFQDYLAWREQQAIPDAAPNQAHSRQRGLNDGRQATSKPRHDSRNNVNEASNTENEQPTARGQQDQQHDAELSDFGWRDFFRSRLKPKADKDDLEGGHHDADADEKPEYDWLGRKLIVGPSRTERKQPPLDPKRTPKDFPTPDATYYDRHGRTELQVFQSLVGIHFLGNAGAPLPNEQKTLQPASVMSDIFVPSRAAAYRHRNRGLYDRCISQDMKMRVMYSFSHYMISFLYLLQILVAATLTGLSSYTNTAGVALTTLGAINTVLAGILAWLNGQGMPVRYRRSRDQFREVVRAIEDAERLFSTIDYMDWPEGTRPTPAGERDRLFKMYEKARQDQEANYPDTHDDADKSEVAATAKTLEAKLEKHKKQKKSKSEEIRALQGQVQSLQEQLAKGSGGAAGVAEVTKSEGGEEKVSKGALEEYAQELEMRRKKVGAAAEAIGREKDSAERAFSSMRQTIVDLCAEKGLDPDEVRGRSS